MDNFYNQVQELLDSLEFDFEDFRVEGPGYEIWLFDSGDNYLAAQVIFKGLQDEVFNQRFKIFDALEALIWMGYQEFQNNDPDSFQYEIDTDHGSGRFIKLKVKCIDYSS